MNEQPNLRTVRQNVDAVSKGDLTSLMKWCTEDVEIVPAPSAVVPWAHPWRGQEEFAQNLKSIGDHLEFLEYAADEFIAGGDSVVVVGHERCRVRATGRVVDAKWVQIFDFHDGLICRHREYTDTAAWDAGFHRGSEG